jgi:hypothetical protein
LQNTTKSHKAPDSYTQLMSLNGERLFRYE